MRQAEGDFTFDSEFIGMNANSPCNFSDEGEYSSNSSQELQVEDDYGVTQKAEAHQNKVSSRQMRQHYKSSKTNSKYKSSMKIDKVLMVDGQ